ncbi:hypothetical protein DV737_g1264, partial [Chaetothyriales sp. CBS 132003]
MSAPPPNYFTCTLGQAQRLNCTRPEQHLLDFLEKQSEHQGDLPALGFYFAPKPSLTQGEWNYRILNFRQVYRGLSRVVESLKLLLPTVDDGETIAILYSSPGLFLFLWLALIATGHLALVISPDWTASVTAKLCQVCNVSIILADDQYESLAMEVSKDARKLGFSPEALSIMPKSDRDLLDLIEGAEEPGTGVFKSTVQMDDVAYLHATSGTSTGIPQPMPQTHRRTVGVLPRLDGSGEATFTTTPLCHGGIADVLRSWTSNALIWLFPTKDMPVTAASVAMCLNTAATACGSRQYHVPIPPIKYFALCADVLPMMAEDVSVVKHLKDMGIVGVGGSSIPAEVGDRLVKDGVNLISRFSCAECGFLMSSHRDYATDKKWQYLRSGDEEQHLKFEKRENGLSDLVVEKGWPHLVTTNRDDGSYDTYDFFEQHVSLANAWRYHSQAGNPYTLMRELVVKYSNFSHLPPANPHLTADSPETINETIDETIVLTGATSSLGAHILSVLLAEPNIHHIYVLVDGEMHDGATTRIQKSFSSRLLPIPPNFSRLVTILPCTFSASDLGLDNTTYTTLLSTATTIMHLAWDDSVLTPLSAFASPHLIGLHNLLTLAANSSLPTAPQFIFSSSTAAVSRHVPPIPEAANLHPSASSTTGLGRSKWVAEQILLCASKHSRLRNRTTIIRMGQLSASLQTGVWSTSDPCVLMLSTAKKNVVGCLPDLDQARREQGREEGEELNWLPVDAAARSFVEASLGKGGQGILRDDASARHDLMELDDGTDTSVGRGSDEAGWVAGNTGLKVIHLLAPPRKLPKKWSSLLIPLKMAAGVKIVGFRNWIALLERLRDEKGPDAHPSVKLVNYWKQEYAKTACDDEELDGEAVKMIDRVSRVSTIDMTSSISSYYDMDDDDMAQLTGGFEMAESLKVMPSLHHVKDVEMANVNKMWKWIKDNV